MRMLLRIGKARLVGKSSEEELGSVIRRRTKGEVYEYRLLVKY